MGYSGIPCSLLVSLANLVHQAPEVLVVPLPSSRWLGSEGLVLLDPLVLQVLQLC